MKWKHEGSVIFQIVTLYEMSLYEPKTELYMMMELMDCDLHRVIQSKQPLSEKHHKCFVKQILEAIKAMHSVGVYHRDLKPGNILVSKDCQVRIADFGLARFMDEDEAGAATDYVVTRWYRCPELLLTKNFAYSAAIDMWSVGCILAELLRRQPLFPGKSHTEQVQLIFQCFGYNSGENLGFPVSEEALGFLEKRCRYRKVPQPLRKAISSASDEAMQLVEALLTIDPVHRPDATAALEFTFLQGAEILNDYNKNYVRHPTADYFDFEKGKQSVTELKRLIELEVQAISANGYRFNKFSYSDSADEGGRPMSDEESSPYNAQTNSGLISSHSQRDLPPNSGSDGGDGPASQMPTQVRNVRATSGAPRSSNNNYPSQTSSNNPYASARNNIVSNANSNQNALNPYLASRLQQGQAGTAADRMELTNEDGYDQPSAAVLADDARRQLAKVLQSNHDSKSCYSSDPDYVQGPVAAANILTAVRNEVGPPGTRGRKSVPKTPSPKKMDMIIQKDINNRQRFAAQNKNSAPVGAQTDARAYRASFPANVVDQSSNQPPRGASAVNPYSSGASSSSVIAPAVDNSSRRKLGPFPVLSRISNALTGRSSAAQSESVDKRINSMLGGGARGGSDVYHQQQYEVNRSAAMVHSGSNVIHNADSYHNNNNPYSSGYPYRK